MNVESVSPTELFDVISGAASQDPVKVKSSSERLKKMLEKFGTYDMLHEIAAQKSVSLPIRQQSIIQFKNAALGHWRSRKLLSDEHRIRIRARCLAFLTEEDDLISECNEVIVSKLARSDFPHNWPNLVSDVMSTIDTFLQQRYASPTENPHEVLILKRGLRVLNAFLKEFSSMKMLTGVKTMTKIVEELHSILCGYYSQISIRFSSVTASDVLTQPFYNDTLIAHLVYKCLVRLATWQWNKNEHPEAMAWIHELFQSSAIQLKTLINLRASTVILLSQTGAPAEHRSIDILLRHIRRIGKFFRRLQQLQPQRFVQLPICVDLIMYYWSQITDSANSLPEATQDSNYALFPVRLLVQAMALFKESLGRWTPIRKDGTENQNSLSLEFIENAVQLLVTRFIPLRPSDLEDWMADPEEWVALEGRDDEHWEFELRPCSERLLMQLASQYAQYVTPLLETIFRQVAVQPSTDLPSILQKEALYCALGRCANRLKDVIPLYDWLTHTLLPEARTIDPNYPIIKRRIAWLIGRWVSESCTSPNNPHIWEVLVHLLQDRGQGSDLVVRLTAAQALRECIDTLEFDRNVFSPFLPTVVSELVRTMGETDYLETKRRVASTLDVVIEQAGELITPLMSVIVQPLPSLWSAAGDEWLFKSSILVTMTKVIEAVKGQSIQLSGVIVPWVQESLSPEAIAHLDEDALILWLTFLRNTTTVHSVNGGPALMSLFPLATSLLETNLDLLGKIIDIVVSYIFLDAPAILQTYGSDLFRAVLTVLKSEAVSLNIKDMIIGLNYLVQLAPASLWAELMHSSGVFAYLLQAVVDGEHGTILLTELIYLFARIIIVDCQIFLQLMSATAATKSLKEDYLYNGLLDQWWARFDNMSEPRHRKLAAMGMASLVSTGRPEVLERLPGEIFNLWLDVFGEIKEARVETTDRDEDSYGAVPLNLKRYWELVEAPDDYYRETRDTLEFDRRKALYDRDPVRSVQLNSYVANHLKQVEAAVGSERFRSIYLAKVDPTVMKQIMDELVRA